MGKATRREFIQSVGVFASVAAWSGFSAGSPENRLPIAFSTLGCPSWSLGKILDFAQSHGFAAVELRGLEGNLDLPSHAAFSPERIAQTKREIQAHGVRIASVSTSASMHEADSEKRKKILDEARRSIDLARALDAPNIRVFGNSPDSENPVAPDQELKQRVAAGLHELGEYAGSRNVTVLMESHDDFTSSTSLEDVFRRADSQHVGLLWDAFHTYTAGHEEPEATVAKLGKWIRHTHLKDGLGSGKDRHYVLTGQGDVPIRRQVAALQGLGYKGFFCFEWEKVWHPELQDPEIAFADYARVMSGYLHESGVK